MFLLHLVVSLSIRALVVNTQLREHRLECGFSTSGPFLTVEDQAAVGNDNGFGRLGLIALGFRVAGHPSRAICP